MCLLLAPVSLLGYFVSESSVGTMELSESQCRSWKRDGEDERWEERRKRTRGVKEKKSEIGKSKLNSQT